MSEAVRLLEYTRGPRPERVDREKGIIYGVKLLGQSGNKDYPRSTREKAHGLLEGRKVFIDHPEPGKSALPRSVRERMGMIKGVHEKDDGSYGNWHFPPKHPLAEAVFWEAENNPEGLGFSINGNGRCKKQSGGRELCEEIVSLESIDLVDNPATTKGLFEGQGAPPAGKDAMTTTVKDLIEQLKTTRPGAARALKEMAEAGLTTMQTPMQAPAPVAKPAPGAPAQAGAEEAKDHEATFIKGAVDAIAAVLNDEGTTWEEKNKAVADYMKTLMKHMAKSGGKKDDAPPGKGDKDKSDDEKTEEGRKMAEANLVERLQLQLKARDLLSEAKVAPSKILLKALEGCKDEAEVKALIEEAQKLAPPAGTPPRSTERGATGQNGTTPITEGKAPTDPKQFAAYARS